MTLNKRGEEKSFLYGNSLRTCNESRKPSNQNIAQRYLANDSTICIKNSGMVSFSILQKKFFRIIPNTFPIYSPNSFII